MNRRTFLDRSGKATLAASMLGPATLSAMTSKKKVAIVGTGIRGLGLWGMEVAKGYSDVVEFVGLCDINPGRLALAQEAMKVSCPLFSSLPAMLDQTRPDLLIVTTVDATHHEMIIEALKRDIDVITEKPLTTEAAHCQSILDAEAKSRGKVTVTFNYRYSPHRQAMYEILRSGEIGDLVSCDFHWYLDTDHGASYFRRWHGLREKSGTLLVHKATHHFDLLNWWLGSEPEEVFAYGSLDFYGKNGPFRHTHCRPCPHKGNCQFHFDITRDDYLKQLYADNEHHDGYLRDGCVFREEINIYDKMTVQIRHANQVLTSYSLTTYSPYEGYRIAFNGTKGRAEAWIKESQPWVPEDKDYDEIRVTKNFGYSEVVQIPHARGGHGGGDNRMLDRIFRSPEGPDPWRQAAGTRDGIMSVLTGIAARTSIEEHRPVRIGELINL